MVLNCNKRLVTPSQWLAFLLTAPSQIAGDTLLCNGAIDMGTKDFLLAKFVLFILDLVGSKIAHCSSGRQFWATTQKPWWKGANIRPGRLVSGPVSCVATLCNLPPFPISVSSPSTLAGFPCFSVGWACSSDEELVGHGYSGIWGLAVFFFYERNYLLTLMGRTLPPRDSVLSVFVWISITNSHSPRTQ